MLCRPYHKDEEDGLDIFVWMTTFLACLASGFLEASVFSGDKLWLAVILNTVGLGTVLAISISIGPDKLRRGTIKRWQKRRRGKAIRNGRIDKISEEDAQQMTEAEFDGFYNQIKYRLLRKFLSAPGFATLASKLKISKKKFDDTDFKQAAKEWREDPVKALETYADIVDWDTSEMTDMSELFKHAEELITT